MTKRKILTYGSIFALALFLSAGLSQASAHFGGMSAEDRVQMQQDMFARQAELLGISVDEVKDAWATGQNIFELAKAKGISEEDLKAKMQSMREAKMKEELQSLVSAGVITQAQADSRLQHMQSMKNQLGEKKGRGHGMAGHMMPFGPGIF